MTSMDWYDDLQVEAAEKISSLLKDPENLSPLMEILDELTDEVIKMVFLDEAEIEAFGAGGIEPLNNDLSAVVAILDKFVKDVLAFRAARRFRRMEIGKVYTVPKASLITIQDLLGSDFGIEDDLEGGGAIR